MLDKLIETLRAWYSPEKGRRFILDLMLNGKGCEGRILLARGHPGEERTNQSIPFVFDADGNWPTECHERILRLIVELQQEAEA
jgi:hypothetical protein